MARHGRTAWNAQGRFQGMGDPPLDEEGERQASTLAAALAALRPVSVTSSDLQRARRTAEAVAAACGVALSCDPGLREVDLGGWEGLTRPEVEARFPDEYRRWRAGEDVRRGGGETRAEAARRFAAVLARIAGATPAGATAVVVAHGVVIQAALDLMASGGRLRAHDLPAEAPHLGHGEWMAIEVEPPVG